MKSNYYLLSFLFFFLLNNVMASNDESPNQHIADYSSKKQWEFGFDYGFSMFNGTLNFYSKDFLSWYRTDGNHPGYSVQAFINRKLNDYFYLGLEGGTTALNGFVNYEGTYEGDSSFDTKGKYDTRNNYASAVILFDIFRLFPSDPSVPRRWRFLLKTGLGISNTNIINTPFAPELGIYNFGSSNTVEPCVPLGFQIMKNIEQNASIYLKYSAIAVGGSKPDAYYLGPDPVNESIPTNPKRSMPRALDVYSTLTFGMSFRF